MIYIRNIFPQDLAGGKQIAFTKEPCNVFFEFDYVNSEPDRDINFKFIETNSTSPNHQFNGQVIKTRLYAAGSESRIDSQLKKFLINNLNVNVDDVLVFNKKRSNTSFEFKFFPKGSTDYGFYFSLLKGGNHTVLITQNTTTLNSISSLKKPINKIVFGAPGTGKSHSIKEELKGLDNYTARVTFHPEYDYVSFVGGYKPTMGQDAKDEEIIKYEFSPQIFTQFYTKAWKDPLNQYYLIIEEINRGNCAEIFGDIFQLLDRDPDYQVSPSNELLKYLKEELKNDGIDGIKDDKMLLPTNLSIYATMNTSDQSLYPMDSAFKRRWDWEYIPIQYKENGVTNKSFDFKVVDVNNVDVLFSWIDFIEKININHIIDSESLGMDKCLGNFFIKPDLPDNKISLSAFINKVIFYLWNDVFKDEDSDLFKGRQYEKFFPIESKGKEHLIEILKILGLNKVDDNSDTTI
jgi:hypothetical protein